MAADNELAALEATRENAPANGVTLGAIERHNLREAPAPAARTVVGEPHAPAAAARGRAADRGAGALILSGLLDEEADEVAAAFAPLRETERRSLQGWSAVLLTG